MFPHGGISNSNSNSDSDSDSDTDFDSNSDSVSSPDSDSDEHAGVDDGNEQAKCSSSKNVRFSNEVEVYEFTTSLVGHQEHEANVTHRPACDRRKR